MLLYYVATLLHPVGPTLLLRRNCLEYRDSSSITFIYTKTKHVNAYRIQSLYNAY